MPVPIYEKDETPKITPNVEWIRLLVHECSTPDDLRALDEFRRLAELLAHPEHNLANTVLTVIRLSDVEAKTFGTIPSIVNDTLWEGVSEIGKFIEVYRLGLERPMVR